MEPPADVPPAPPPPDDPYRCPRCGAPHDAFQEYCLECGMRLVPLRAEGASWRREVWTRESPLWFWATFLALLLIALVAAAIVIAATDDDDRARGGGGTGPGPTSSLFAIPTNVTTGTLPTTPPPPATTATATVPTFPGTTTRPATTSPTTTGADGTTRPTTTSPTTTPAGGGTVIAWPNRDGYTVVLDSIPVSRERSRAVARAETAIDRGLAQVGVLNSSDFASLRAGYYVVFAGIHDTEAQARAAVPEARSAGYPHAYPREIDRG